MLRLSDLTYILNRKTAQALGAVRKNAVHVFWFEAQVNFGDLLNPVLFRHYGLTPIKQPARSADVLAIGSVLDNLPRDFSGIIAGSGLMSDMRLTLPHAKIMAVRGKLTRERIGAPLDTPLGDPGLLVPLLYKQQAAKRYVLGLVPHYKDKNDPRLQSIKQRYGRDVCIIDVQRNPARVISEMNQCSCILSSSLHGLVTADALGIPNGWMLLSDGVHGNGFKFFDYASALGRVIVPHTITGSETLPELTGLSQKVMDTIPAVQDNLDAVFLELARIILELRGSYSQKK